MAIRDPHAAIIHCKIVYYGPGTAGKTSNLQTIHSLLPPDQRGDLKAMATETERTLFFDCTPADVPAIRGHMLRFHLYTIPGCVLEQRARRSVLQGTDGIVFVADSQRDKLQEDIKSLQEMVKGLYAIGQSLESVPIVLQYNKRDIPNALPVAVMDKYLNPFQWPRFESSMWWRENDSNVQIRRTVGVMETFQAIHSRIRERLEASAAYVKQD
jgi:mutual gliding-motility protein MglA